jgi:hypothetical protein
LARARRTLRPLLIHKKIFYLWLSAMALHVAAHVTNAVRWAYRDLGSRLRISTPGARQRLAVVFGCIVLGTIVGLALAGHAPPIFTTTPRPDHSTTPIPDYGRCWRRGGRWRRLAGIRGPPHGGPADAAGGESLMEWISAIASPPRSVLWSVACAI